MRYPIFVLLLMAGTLLACANAGADSNPAQPGFDHEGSDPRAIQIADEVMASMGGRRAWDNTRHLRWNFFGNRKLYWDKWTGDVRIEIPAGDTRILVNINDETGRVWRDGAELSHPDSISKYVQRGKSIWINDSYWLTMPFKMKDSGVTLSYLGDGETADGRPAHILGLRFQNVGDTPDNRYEVYVDKENKLVTQWSYFRDRNMEEPNFTGSWSDYNEYNGILLSGGRGEREITDIAVYDELPSDVYHSFDDVDL
jgi:hypothetical protein